MNLTEKTKEIIDDIFDLPKTFCAWIVFHLASWLDMRVISNDNREEIFDELWKEPKNVDIKDIDD